jgi:hypothetical protein
MPDLSEFYNEVSRITDTDETKINVAETKRVLACAFDVLRKKPAKDVMGLIAAGLEASHRRSGE